MYKNRLKYAIYSLCALGFINLVLSIALIASGPNDPPPPAMTFTAHRPDEVAPDGQLTADKHKLNHEIYASVYLGCSGTIISKGKDFGYGLSCSHCYGVTGDRFTVHFANGTKAPAEVVARSKFSMNSGDPDLMLFKVPSSSILTTIPVCLNQVPDDGPFNYAVVGYPQHQGPIWYDLDTKGNLKYWGQERWVFRVHNDEGEIKPGNSGSGIFINGALCSVLSHRDLQTGNYETWTCPHAYLVKFCEANCRKEGGIWYCDKPRKGSAPPPAEWKPTPKEDLNQEDTSEDDEPTAKSKKSPRHPRGLSDRLDTIDAAIKELKDNHETLTKNQTDLQSILNKNQIDLKSSLLSNNPTELINKVKADILNNFKDQLTPLQQQILSNSNAQAELTKLIADLESRLKADIAKNGFNPSDLIAELQATKAELKADMAKQFPLLGGAINQAIEDKTGALGSTILQGNSELLKNINGSNGNLITKVEGVVEAVASKGAGPGLGTILGISGIAGGLPAIVLGVFGYLIHSKLKGQPTLPVPTNGNEEDIITKLVDSILSQNAHNSTPTTEPTAPTPSSPTPAPLPVTPTGGAPFVVNNPGPPQTIPQVSTVVVNPKAKDTGVQAFQAVKQMIVRLHPELVQQGILQKLDSMFNQALSGLQG